MQAEKAPPSSEHWKVRLPAGVTLSVPVKASAAPVALVGLAGWPVMLALELGQQLALARGRIVGDFPAEMRHVTTALEERMDQFGAQRRASAARAADEHDLVVVPELEHAGRIRCERDESREHEPFRAPDRHAAVCAPGLSETFQKT